ncbi:hypothetical protein AQUCO_00100657v1 [Aquilegia coerulea]|uniref:2-oxoglutarate-dependent dioxygenase DAO n=1 Tax=Aquilegia coerulea TaxID=218851 RepID=A0A2G5FBD1_AQUCA|nr:hypothetical protein AQUCO_00100657v1 [Aquilegia coerulea]
MDSKVGNQIPCIDFTKDPQNLEEDSDGWKELCNQVREACERYGSFQVIYNKIPSSLCQNVFSECKGLFDLPDETKQKNLNPKPYFGYLGKSDILPFYEGFGVEDAPIRNAVQNFMDKMWPEGNPNFCETLHSISTKLLDLELIVLKMLCDIYGLEKHHKSLAESFENLFRVMKYKLPPQSDAAVVLGTHTDKGSLTILSQDEVQGLEVLSKDCKWLQATPLKGAFIVFIGESLKAWSNGRLYAAKHRVILSGDKERYSFALFASPKEGEVVEVPKELVDKEHPLLYKPFNFMDFLYEFFNTDLRSNENPLEAYAGV